MQLQQLVDSSFFGCKTKWLFHSYHLLQEVISHETVQCVFLPRSHQLNECCNTVVTVLDCVCQAASPAHNWERSITHGNQLGQAARLKHRWNLHHRMAECLCPAWNSILMSLGQLDIVGIPMPYLEMHVSLDSVVWSQLKPAHVL